MKKLLALLLCLVMVLGLAACGGDTNPSDGSDKPSESNTPSGSDGPTPSDEPTSEWDGAYMDADDYKAYIAHDLDQMVTDMSEQLTADQKTAVDAAVAEGKEAINAAGTVADVLKAYDAAFAAVLNCVPKANGIFSFSAYSDTYYEDRVGMLAALETYAYRTGTCGIPLYENTSVALYNERLTLGTETYIPGYGFGNLSEGSITADLEYESNPAWKRYYHALQATDLGTMNALNSQDDTTMSLHYYIGGMYFDTFMNDTKDGYVWTPVLALTMPEAMNDDDGNGAATKWRFQVRTGADGLKYSTLSEMESRKAFNDRPVELEDYLTPYKLMLTQSNNLYRGGEMANNSTGAIVGVKAFYDGTANGFNQTLWDQVGIKAYEEDGKSYLEIEYTQELSPFYAMYYCNSDLYAPLPQDFVDLVTVQNLMGFNKEATETPVDNSLSTGFYTLEKYTKDQEIVFKKNPNWPLADTKYNIEGYHIRIFPAANTDTEAAFNEFLAGHTDGASVPQTRLDEYRNDPRARTVAGDTVWKLNINALDQETWIQLFGENGTVKQNDPTNYWECEPALNNAHFRQGILLSIDRVTFANARAYKPSVDFFPPTYLWQPEQGLAYSDTEEHKTVVKPLTEGTDGYGYSLELARDYFRAALMEMESEGIYSPGTPENPTVITLEIAWLAASQEESIHNELKNYMETAFNDPSVSGGKYKLECEFWVGAQTTDVYYNKILVGQFDIGFGSISGNQLNPLDFMSVLSANQDISNGFTLNWGSDTNDPDVYPIVFQGQRYSYDALYNAANTQVIASEGASTDVLSFEYTPMVKNDDGSYTGSMLITPALPDVTTFTVTDVVCCNYERYNNGDGTYDESPVEFTAEDAGNGAVKITFTVPAGLAADYATGSGTSAEPKGDTGFDFYYDVTLDGNTSNGYYSTYDNFEVE